MNYNTLKEMLYDVSTNNPDNCAFIDINEHGDLFNKKYAEFLSEIEYLGTGLLKLGIGQNRTVIIGKNSYEWALSFFTSMFGKGITIPLDKELSDKEIINCVNRIKADTIIYSDEFSNRIENIKAKLVTNEYISMKNNTELSLEKIIEIGKIELENGNNEYVNNEIDKDEAKEYIFTSGTTSESKIVMLSHYNIINNAINAKKLIHIDENDTFLSVLPIHHTFENTCGLVTPLCSGSTIAYNDSLKNVVKNLKRIKPTVILVVPRFIDVFYESIVKGINKSNKKNIVNKIIKVTKKIKKMNSLKRKIFKEIHDQFGGNLRLIIVGGAAADPEISKFMRSIGFNVLQGYGLTECSPMVTVNSDNKFKDDSVGIAVPETNIKIVNLDENGIGEIAVKGPQVMKGYYENEEATKAVIKEDGYFYTGDLGKIDNQGFVTIKGRCKNLIIASNGKNVYPEEIEEIINNGHLIKESMVYGKEKGNNRLDIMVDIVLNDEIRQKIQEYPEYRTEIMEVIKEYISEINKNLPDYKQINKFNIRDDEFEKTTTLKIKRHKNENLTK